MLTITPSLSLLLRGNLNLFVKKPQRGSFGYTDSREIGRLEPFRPNMKWELLAREKQNERRSKLKHKKRMNARQKSKIIWNEMEIRKFSSLYVCYYSHSWTKKKRVKLWSCSSPSFLFGLARLTETFLPIYWLAVCAKASRSWGPPPSPSFHAPWNSPFPPSHSTC